MWWAVERRWGHIVMMSPPVEPDASAHHGAYAVSKFGMTLLALAIAGEHRADNVAAHALWPATAIESAATTTFFGDTHPLWRKADILADATVALISKEPGARSGESFIDEDVLRGEGVTDFTEGLRAVRTTPGPVMASRARRHHELQGFYGQRKPCGRGGEARSMPGWRHHARG